MHPLYFKNPDFDRGFFLSFLII